MVVWKGTVTSGECCDPISGDIEQLVNGLGFRKFVQAVSIKTLSIYNQLAIP